MTAAISVRALTKAFGQVIALEEISFDIPLGATHFLLGPNGSGKTTLIRVMSGVLRPTSGSVRVLGESPYQHPERLSRDVGIAYEDHFLPPWASAEDYLDFAAKMRGIGEDAVWDAAEVFGLTDYWEREMGTYSAGMRKRVILAQAWLGDPHLLILDEPFSSLDQESRILLTELLEARSSTGKTTFVATHLAETVTPPTHLACLVNGRLEAGGPIESLSDRYVARTVAFEVPDPSVAVRVLLERGIEIAAATPRSVVLRGDTAHMASAREVLEEAGIPVKAVEESYDIWMIYRSVLTASRGEMS